MGREILRRDPCRQSRCVQLLDTFVHPKHFCLVFEQLGVSFHEFLAANEQRGLLVADLRSIARQLLTCLAFLHALGLVHADLKCRNIMLRDQRYELLPHPRIKGSEVRRLFCSDIVLIDFGAALFKSEWHSGRIGTRHYRSPEVILGLPWDYTADIWSAGCVFMLLYLGGRIFCTPTDAEQLASMQRVMARDIPRYLGCQARSSNTLPLGVFFDDQGKLQWPASVQDSDAVRRVQKLLPLKEQVLPQHRLLLDLLEGLLELDPQQRMSATSAADLPFCATAVEIHE